MSILLYIYLHKKVCIPGHPNVLEVPPSSTTPTPTPTLILILSLSSHLLPPLDDPPPGCSAFLSSCCLSRISRMAARALRLPPSLGPRRISSDSFLLAAALALLGGRGAFFRRCRRSAMASMNSRRNCSAMRSSAASSGLMASAAALCPLPSAAAAAPAPATPPGVSLVLVVGGS